MGRCKFVVRRTIFNKMNVWICKTFCSFPPHPPSVLHPALRPGKMNCMNCTSLSDFHIDLAHGQDQWEMCLWTESEIWGVISGSLLPGCRLAVIMSPYQGQAPVWHPTPSTTATLRGLRTFLSRSPCSFPSAHPLQRLGLPFPTWSAREAALPTVPTNCLCQSWGAVGVGNVILLPPTVWQAQGQLQGRVTGTVAQGSAFQSTPALGF